MAKTERKDVDLIGVRLPSRTVKVMDKHIAKINSKTFGDFETRSSFLRKLITAELTHAG